MDYPDFTYPFYEFMKFAFKADNLNEFKHRMISNGVKLKMDNSNSEDENKFVIVEDPDGNYLQVF